MGLWHNQKTADVRRCPTVLERRVYRCIAWRDCARAALRMRCLLLALKGGTSSKDANRRGKSLKAARTGACRKRKAYRAATAQTRGFLRSKNPEWRAIWLAGRDRASICKCALVNGGYACKYGEKLGSLYGV